MGIFECGVAVETSFLFAPQTPEENFICNLKRNLKAFPRRFSDTETVSTSEMSLQNISETFS